MLNRWCNSYVLDFDGDGQRRRPSHWAPLETGRRETYLLASNRRRPDFASRHLVVELKPFEARILSAVLTLARKSATPQTYAVEAEEGEAPLARKTLDTMVQVAGYMRQRGARYCLLFSGSRGIVVERGLEDAVQDELVERGADDADGESELAAPHDFNSEASTLQLKVWNRLYVHPAEEVQDDELVDDVNIEISLPPFFASLLYSYSFLLSFDPPLFPFLFSFHYSFVKLHWSALVATIVKLHWSALIATIVKLHLSALIATIVKLHLSALIATIVKLHLSALVVTIVKLHWSALVVTIVQLI